jgi:tetratricopeptide (TPR) repeat protein
MALPDGQVFIIHHFDEESRSRAKALADILNTHNISSVFGEDLCGLTIPDGIRKILEASTMAIALLTRDVKTDEGKWQPSQSVIEEVTSAIMLGKPVLLVAEDGVFFNGGLTSELEKIYFKEGGFASAIYRIIYQTQKMMTGAITLPELPREDLDVRVKYLIIEIREAGKKKLWDEVERLSKEALQLDRKAWRAWTSYGVSRGKKGYLSEAEKIFLEMLELFADNENAVAIAYYNLGWIEEMRGGNQDIKSLRKQVKYYKKSIKFEAAEIHTRTRAALVICYALMQEKEKANALFTESLDYSGFLPDALRYEVESRGWLGHKALKVLPEWVYLVLFPTRDSNDEKN